jgi:hypothetical protein
MFLSTKTIQGKNVWVNTCCCQGVTLCRMLLSMYKLCTIQSVQKIFICVSISPYFGNIYVWWLRYMVMQWISLRLGKIFVYNLKISQRLNAINYYRYMSVGIATCHGLDYQWIESRWRRDFSCRPDRPPVQWLLGFPRWWSGRSVVLTTHLHLLPTLWMGFSCTSALALCQHRHAIGWHLPECK